MHCTYGFQPFEGEAKKVSAIAFTALHKRSSAHSHKYKPNNSGTEVYKFESIYRLVVLRKIRSATHDTSKTSAL